MADESPWQPPTDQRGSDEPVAPSSAEPVLPTLPPVAPSSAEPVLPTLPPVTASSASPPPSPWAPGGSADGPTALATPQPASAVATIEQAPTGAAPSPGADVPSPPWPPVPTVEALAPPPPRSRRSKWLVGGAVASVVAVGAAGIFAFSNLSGSTEGGADAPAELGQRFLDALEGEDVLGIIDTLLPGERRSLGEPAVDVVTELRRIGVLADDVDLSRILGIDVELSNESIRAVSTNVPDIVNVSMSADVVVTVDGEQLPIGDLVTDNLPAEQLTELRGTRMTQTDVLEVELTAVEEDGRWYFSLFHTLAEVLRREAGAELIPVQGVGAAGAESPEAAVDQLLERIEELDLTGFIRTLDPDEAAALQRYAPLFLDEAEAALAEVPLTWEITDRQFRFEGSGDERTVFVDGLTIDGRVEDTSFTVAFADGCLTASTSDGESFEACSDTAGILESDEFLADAPEIAGFVDTLRAAFDDVEPIGLELRARDGEWFVSPLATSTEALLKLLRALDREEAQAIADAGVDALDAFEDSISGALDDLVLGGTGGMVVDDSLLDDMPLDVPMDDVPFDVPADGSASDPDWVACYDEGSADAAIACFTEFVDAGTLDPATMPLELRFPECGLAEVTWDGSLYQLPDAEFIATLETARPCFLALVEQGLVEEWELADEVLMLECFEGRNWYQVFDDPEYDDRFATCTSARYGD